MASIVKATITVINQLISLTATESWLKPKHFNLEFCPLEFDFHRKDRTSERGGGVFFAIHLKFTSTADTDLVTDCELLWVKIREHKNLYIGTYK